MKKLKMFIIFLAAVAFVLIPLPAADVYVRIQFSEVQGENCALYYATAVSPGFSQDKCIISDIDYDKKQVTFRLDSSLEGQLTGLRLDFPVTDALIGVEKVTISSAGIIQKQYNPCDFFAEENIAHVNQAEYSLVIPKNRFYVAPKGEDPYMILSETPVRLVNQGYSHFTLSRIGMCLFAAGCYFFAKKKVFSEE